MGKHVGHLFTGVGILILVLTELGVFVSTDRGALVEALRREPAKRRSPQEPGVEELLDRFLPTTDQSRVVGVFLLNAIASGGVSDAGKVMAAMRDDPPPILVCSLQDAIGWSKELGKWAWLGIGVATIGLLWDVLISRRK